MLLSDFDYDLPPELIAQRPAEPRDSARLLVYERAADRISHARVSELPGFLPPRTLLVANNSRVRHSRLYGRLEGAPTEVLVVEPLAGDRYRCLLRGRGIADGSRVSLYADPGLSRELPLSAIVEGREDVPGMTTFILAFAAATGTVEGLIESHGHLPLPPYIKEAAADESRYQTVYAKELGSAAAPTAGLHFTPDLLRRLDEAGHRWDEVTLHVGLGTFLPLRQERVTENRLHREATYLAPGVAARVDAARAAGERVLAVGTTSLRTLESHAAAEGIRPGWLETDLFIYPGYRFQAASALLTNFHLPKSSLLVLVAAFLANPADGTGPLLGDREAIGRLQRLYSEAVRERYRFFSFGDAMLIL